MGHQKPDPFKQQLATPTVPPEHRIPPRDPNIYLSTSPWQTMSYEYELRLKRDLLAELFSFSGEFLGETSETLKTWPDGLPANYRNKNHNSVIPDAENLSEKSLYGASAVYLPKSSHLLKLLQRIRDESHRFAITYHSLLKSKSLLGKK